MRLLSKMGILYQDEQQGNCRLKMAYISSRFQLARIMDWWMDVMSLILSENCLVNNMLYYVF